MSACFVCRRNPAMFTDDQLLPLSALQHYVFCRRRAALVHIEGLWSENRFTAEGNVVHAHAHDDRRKDRRGLVETRRGMELRSYVLGLTGKADVVEFHSLADGSLSRVVLVEYKRGRARPDVGREFEIQVCGQALCLEEQLGRTVDEACLYYAKSKTRVSVVLSPELRAETEAAITGLHALIASGTTPTAKYARKCRRCSLIGLCLPKALRPKATASRYLAAGIAGAGGAPLLD